MLSRSDHVASVQVAYGTQLDLGPYLSRPAAPGAHTYELYGVVVHEGGSVHSGHYYAYVRGPNGMWSCMDDDHVSLVRDGPFGM